MVLPAAGGRLRRPPAGPVLRIVEPVGRDRIADTRTFRFHLRNALYQSKAERHPAVGSQVARMEPQVGEGGQDDAEGGQPGPGVDRLRPASGWTQVSGA